MFLPDNFRRERAGTGGQRIHGWENTQRGDRAFQNDGRVQVREGRRGRRIGQVVRRNVDGLKACDRTFFGRGDAFLQVTHFGGERRLITDGTRRAAEERGDFRTGL